MKKLKNLILFLKKNNLTVASVESATGGYLGYLLTKIPGSSQIFKGGIIAYQIEIKNKFCKIPLKLLKKNNGVSYKICYLLVKKIRKIFKTNFGLAIVGYAGPEKIKKKEGKFFIGISSSKKIKIKKLYVKGKRNQTRKKVANYLLEIFYNYLKNA